MFGSFPCNFEKFIKAICFLLHFPITRYLNWQAKFLMGYAKHSQASKQSLTFFLRRIKNNFDSNLSFSLKERKFQRIFEPFA